MTRKFYSVVLFLALLSGQQAFAVEPPFIVDESEPEAFVEDKPDVEIPQKEALSTAKHVDTVRIERIQFQGGSVFELEDLAQLVEPLIGKDVSKADIVKVLRAITARYKDAGYALSFAFLPKQNTADGLLTIALVEGYVARSEIEISDANVKRRIERLAAKLHNEKPLKQATFERYVSLIESTPGYKFKIRVPKPKTLGGGTTIRVEEAKAEWITTSLGFDDSKEEELRLLASATLNGLTSYGDSLTVSTLLPNDTIDAYYAINYRQDIGADGLQLELSGNHFESQGDDRIFVADIPVNYQENKDRDRFKAGLKYPLYLQKNSAWWLGGNLHHLDENSIYELSRADGAGQAVEIEKELRYSAFELYSNWYKQTKRQVFRLSGSIKQGMDLGGQRNQINDANGSRKGSETTHFNALRFDAAWRYLISPRWRLQSKANLFWSDDILPSAEQIRYGGPRFGRGYADGQAQGDEGMAAELELRYLQPLPMVLIKRLEPYVVVDAAKTRLRSNGNEQELVSAAVGVDITDGTHYNLGLEYAKPLGDVHFESGDRSPIYNVRVRWQF